MKKKSIKIIVVIVILILFGSLTTAYSVLSRKDYSIIRIAFMNGYIEALNLNIEEKKKLANDKILLAKKVKSATENYLAKVEGLNR